MAIANTLITMRIVDTVAMGDTKRGRERKGRSKREQRRRADMERAASTREEELDFDRLYEEDIEL